MRVLALTSYARNGASSRLRVYQFETHLNDRGINCDIRPLLSDDYVALRYQHPRKARLRALRSMISRVMTVLTSSRYDAVWLQREALPWLPPFLERWLTLRKIPYVVDYDDAVFHQYDTHASGWVRRLLGQKIDTVMRLSETVVVGNQYLADRATAAGAKNVVGIPTVIDAHRYVPRRYESTDEVLNIGWIGTPVTSKFLKLIEEPLRQASRQVSLRLVTIGAGDYAIDGVEVVNLDWSEQTEVADIQRFDVGVMPLEDALWERGKCGYKIIQYLACSVPAIASPVGVNTDIVDEGEVGWLASTPEDWLNWFVQAAEHRGRLTEMGRRGREKVENQYSIHAVIDELAAVFRRIGGTD